MSLTLEKPASGRNEVIEISLQRYDRAYRKAWMRSILLGLSVGKLEMPHGKDKPRPIEIKLGGSERRRRREKDE